MTCSSSPLGWRERNFSLLWNGSQSSRRAEGDHTLLEWLWGRRYSYFCLLVWKQICLLTWKDNLISFQGCFYYSGSLKRLSVPFAQPMQTGEILMENILLRKNLRYQMRGLDMGNVGHVFLHSLNLCPRQTSPITCGVLGQNPLWSLLC